MKRCNGRSECDFTASETAFPHCLTGMCATCNTRSPRITPFAAASCAAASTKPNSSKSIGKSPVRSMTTNTLGSISSSSRGGPAGGVGLEDVPAFFCNFRKCDGALAEPPVRRCEIRSRSIRDGRSHSRATVSRNGRWGRRLTATTMSWSVAVGIGPTHTIRSPWPTPCIAQSEPGCTAFTAPSG